MKIISNISAYNNKQCMYINYKYIYINLYSLDSPQISPAKRYQRGTTK